ncbi:hypothetical protein Tco_0586588 [Tanacetum coccineum]
MCRSGNMSVGALSDWPGRRCGSVFLEFIGRKAFAAGRLRMRCKGVEGFGLHVGDEKGGVSVHMSLIVATTGGVGDACKLLRWLVGDVIEVLEVLGCLKMG